MDVHKPKPWHGFREFLKEYLIIVVGVLTALAAESLVDELRWADRTRQTEEHLRAKVRTLTAWANERLAMQPCTDDMLDRLRDALEADGEAWKAPFVLRAGPDKSPVVAVRRTWAAEDWNAALADGTANHLPKDELMRFSAFFEWVGNLKRFSDREETDVAELRTLTSVKRLDPATRARYLDTVYRMRQSGTAMSVYSRNLLAGAKGLKVTPGTVDDAIKWDALQTPLGRAACRAFYANQPELVIADPSLLRRVQPERAAVARPPAAPRPPE